MSKQLGIISAAVVLVAVIVALVVSNISLHGDFAALTDPPYQSFLQAELRA